jgi:hypothetical protein
MENTTAMLIMNSNPEQRRYPLVHLSDFTSSSSRRSNKHGSTFRIK